MDGASVPSGDVLTLPPARELPQRLARCVFGLGLFGIGVAMMLRGELGAGPWDVFHTGLSDLVGISVGKVNVLMGIVVVALWWPLRQWPGIGTLLNVLTVGFTVDAAMAVIPEVEKLAIRVPLMLGGVVVIAIGSGLYIGGGLGSGPRDGLMLGLNRRFGWSIRSARTTVELVVLALGIALGGSVGVGTLVFALAIGPLAQIALKHLSLPPAAPIPKPSVEVDQ